MNLITYRFQEVTVCFIISPTFSSKNFNSSCVSGHSTTSMSITPQQHFHITLKSSLKISHCTRLSIHKELIWKPNSISLNLQYKNYQMPNKDEQEMNKMIKKLKNIKQWIQCQSHIPIYISIAVNINRLKFWVKTYRML